MQDSTDQSVIRTEVVIPRRAYITLLSIPALVILDEVAKRVLWAWFG